MLPFGEHFAGKARERSSSIFLGRRRCPMPRGGAGLGKGRSPLTVTERGQYMVTQGGNEAGAGVSCLFLILQRIEGKALVEAKEE